MASYKGFSTVNQQKKFGLIDHELIKRDLLNSFLIREGEVPGRPDLGTNIWNFIFEPLDTIVRLAIKNEVTRIVELDPRLKIEQVNLTSDQHTIIIEVELFILPNVNPEVILLRFEEDSNSLNIV